MCYADKQATIEAPETGMTLFWDGLLRDAFLADYLSATDNGSHIRGFIGLETMHSFDKLVDCYQSMTLSTGDCLSETDNDPHLCGFV